MDAIELAEMQADSDSMLPDTCTVSDTLVTQKAGGGWDDAPTGGTSVACRVGAARRVWLQEGGTLITDTRWPITLAAGTVISVGKFITYKSSVYRIVEYEPRSWEISVRAMMQRLDT